MILDLHFADKVRAETRSGGGTRDLGRVIVGQGTVTCRSRGSGRGLNLRPSHDGDESGHLIESNQEKGASRGAHEGGGSYY